ncbi:glycosyltransferase [Nocardioides pacificus]
MIGWYVHHQGHGHLHRARAVAEVLAARGESVTGLSSLARPAGWAGEWVQLARDDVGSPRDVSAGGRLHWVPLGDPGLRERSAAVSAWIDRAAPEVMVVDVSVEVALLARLHGVPVVSVVLPGDRRDAAHRLGYDVSSALVALWPAEAEGMVVGPGDLTGVPGGVLGGVLGGAIHHVGALARYPVVSDSETGRAPRSGTRRQVVVLHGSGGGGLSPQTLETARAQTPDWDWTVLGGPGGWVADPWPVITAADVVVTHAGQNALAEVAAARRPAVVVPQERPHREQRTTAGALAAGGWPVVVEPVFPVDGWAARLAAAAALDGTRWERWCDGRAADRFADIVVEQLTGAAVAPP